MITETIYFKSRLTNETMEYKNDLYKNVFCFFCFLFEWLFQFLFRQHTCTRTWTRFPLSCTYTESSMPPPPPILSIPQCSQATSITIYIYVVPATAEGEKKIPGGTTPMSRRYTHCVNLTQHLAPCSPNTINNTNKHCNYVKVLVRSTGCSHGGYHVMIEPDVDHR